MWQRTLWLIVGLQLTISMGRSIAFPFMPLYLIELGVRPLQSVEWWSGAITSVGFLMAALSSPLWGSIADRHGRKLMVVRSSVAVAVTTGLLALVHTAWQVFALRAATGVFSGFSAAALALVGTQVPEEQLGYALGWIATAQMLGTLIGPLAGGLLADHFHDYRAVFLITSGITAIAAIACAAFLREDRSPLAAGGAANRAPFWNRLATLAARPALVPMLLVVLLAQVCALGVSPIMALVVRSLVHNGGVATAAGAAVAATGIGGVISAPLLGRRGDAIGYRTVLLVSLAGAALFTVPQAFADNVVLFIGLRFGVGLFIGGILPSANAWIGRRFAASERGTIYGLTASATLSGQAIGPLFGAGIAGRFGFHAAFAAIGALMIANLLWVAVVLREEPPRAGEPAGAASR